jgi:hypothetical protein
MLVAALEPRRTLLLVDLGSDTEVSQSWVLYPLDAGHTRLLLRVRAGVPPGAEPGAGRPLALAVLDPAKDIRRRAEMLAGASGWNPQQARRHSLPVGLVVAP